MATTYEWNCKTVDIHPTEGEHTDVVYNVHWIVTGVSDQLDPQEQPYTSTSIGTQILNTEDITDFIPIEDVTNDQVVAWTKAAMGEEQVESIESGIQEAIDLKINPTSVTMTIGD
jgi:hypothetical protein